jgi:hypothetical protein
MCDIEADEAVARGDLHDLVDHLQLLRIDLGGGTGWA